MLAWLEHLSNIFNDASFKNIILKSCSIYSTELKYSLWYSFHKSRIRWRSFSFSCTKVCQCIVQTIV